MRYFLPPRPHLTRDHMPIHQFIKKRKTINIWKLYMLNNNALQPCFSKIHLSIFLFFLFFLTRIKNCIQGKKELQNIRHLRFVLQKWAKGLDTKTLLENMCTMQVFLVSILKLWPWSVSRVLHARLLRIEKNRGLLSKWS